MPSASSLSASRPRSSRTPRTCATTTATLAQRGFYQYLDHPETGISLYDGPIVKLHSTPGELAAPAPLFGEHTFAVATELLNYTPEQAADLTAAGILS